jgi:hypothetical protein
VPTAPASFVQAAFASVRDTVHAQVQLEANLADRVTLLAQRANLIAVEDQFGLADGLASFPLCSIATRHPIRSSLSRCEGTPRAAKLAK